MFSCGGAGQNGRTIQDAMEWNFRQGETGCRALSISACQAKRDRQYSSEEPLLSNVLEQLGVAFSEAPPDQVTGTRKGTHGRTRRL